jgi:murein tripeptide amidase MpaA
MTIKISDQFDAGAIEVVRAEAPLAIELNLRPDSHAGDIRQWFYFRLQGARGETCSLRILNAGQAAFAAGWENYQALASYDREHWFRVPTSYDGQVLQITFTPQQDSVYFAYFEPYSWERHLRLLGRAQASPLVRLQDLGSTLDGRDLNLLMVGDPVAQKKIWIIAHSHATGFPLLIAPLMAPLLAPLTALRLAKTLPCSAIIPSSSGRSAAW